jgi:hypothetical protein
MCSLFPWHHGISYLLKCLIFKEVVPCEISQVCEQSLELPKIKKFLNSTSNPKKMSHTTCFCGKQIFYSNFQFFRIFWPFLGEFTKLFVFMEFVTT